MTKSGLKLIGVGLLMLGVGAPLAKATDEMKGTVAYIAIGVSVILCVTGLATLLYGLYKFVAGLIKHT